MSIEAPIFAPPRSLDSPKAEVSGVHYGRPGEGGPGMDGDLIVEFYIKPYAMEFLSESMGFPIFQDRVWVRIVTPGNNKSVWDTLAAGIEYDTAIDPKSGEYHTTWEIRGMLANGERPDPEKYPNAWARFMKRGQITEMGWPVEEWGAITRSYAESLKMMNIPTVEALAALSDSAAGSFMGGRKYRDLAKAALSERDRNQIVAHEQAKAARLEEKANLQDEKIRQLEAMLATMQAQFAQGMQVAQQMPQVTAPSAPKLKSASVKTSARTRAITEGTEEA